MAVKYSAERLIIKYELDDDVFDVEELSASLAALAKEFNKAQSSQGIEQPTKLLVTKMESNCLQYEIAMLTMSAMVAAMGDGGSTLSTALMLFDFGERINKIVGYLSGKNKDRPESLDRDTAKNMEAFLRPMGGRRGGSFSLKKARYTEKTGKDGTREVIAEYDFNEHDLSTAMLNAVNESQGKSADAKPTHKIKKNVLFYWYQVRKDAAHEKGTSGDRGIIQKIYPKPLPVFFPSEGSELKNKMVYSQANPLKTQFVVTVDVQYVGEKPALYTIMKVHDQDPIDDDETEPS